MQEEELRLASKIDRQSEELGQKLGKVLKASAIIGVGFLAGYSIYKMIAPGKQTKAKTITKGSRADSKLSKFIVTNLISKGLPRLLDYIRNLEKNGQPKNDATAKMDQ